jgi:hypothetical protein
VSYIGKQPDVVAVPSNSSIINAQVAVNAAIEATKLSFTQSGTGAVARTVESKQEDFVSVKDFGAVGDGVADDLTAIQAALTASKFVYFPAGSYRVTAPITLSIVGQTLMGTGGCAGNTRSVSGSSGVVGTGSNQSATQIIGDFNGGPVIRISNQGCAVSDMTISRSVTAYSAAFNLTDQGIRIAPNDATGYQTARYTRLNNLRVMNQPGDGVLLVCDTVNTRVANVEVNCVKGAGFMIAGGSYLGYTNRGKPGQVIFDNCVSCWTGGHGFRAGGDTAEADYTDHPYRIMLINFEAFYNCIIPANCVSSPAISNLYFSADNSTILNSAFDGRSEFPSNAITHSAAVFRGENIRYTNSRMVQCLSPAAYVESVPANFGNFTAGVDIENLYVVNSSQGSNYFNPVVAIASGVKGVNVSCNLLTNTLLNAIVSLTNRPVNTLWRETLNGNVIQGKQPQIVTDSSTSTGYFSPPPFDLNDNQACYFEFSTTTWGLILLSGNTSSAPSAVIAFRVGDSNKYASSIGGSSSIATTTGQLTGLTGASGKLTISADESTRRIYVENRLGFVCAPVITFMNLVSLYPNNTSVSNLVLL